MKKFLLLSMALGIGHLTFAQNLTPMQVKAKKMTEGSDKIVEFQGVIGSKPTGTTSGTKAVTINPFSSSLNMFTAIGSDQVCLSVIPATKTIGFIHREGGAYSTPPTINESLRVKYTSNNGTSWDSLFIPGNSSHRFRYPSGALYNKPGNTDPGNIIVTYTGPNTNGSGFDSCYLGSARLDGSSIVTKYVPYASATTYLNHMNASNSVGDDKYVHAYSTHYEAAGGSGTWDKWTILSGLLDDSLNVMAWNTPVEIVPGPAAFAGGGYYSAGMAFSQDGSVGYFYAMAKDSSNVGNSAPQPVIWKTVNQGATWTGPTYFDFKTVAGFKDFLWPYKNDTSTFEPFFSAGDNSSGAVVDKDGYLHIFSVVKGLYTPWTPDSSGITFKYEPMHLVDVYQTATGWDVKYITDLKTASVASDDPAALASSGGNPIGWDHRIQASRSLDGNNLFCAWSDQADSSYLDNTTYSVSVPDVYVYGWDVTTDFFTPVVNVTKFTFLDAKAFFHYFGDKVIHDGTDFFLPITATVPDGTADDPPTHYFIGGVKFGETEFTDGIKENKLAASNIQVSQNYPNPFNGTTRISVQTKVASQLSLEVTDLLGKNVMTINKGKVNAGTHEFVLNAGSLDSGIYFYTVKSGNDRFTKKMIVE